MSHKIYVSKYLNVKQSRKCSFLNRFCFGCPPSKCYLWGSTPHFFASPRSRPCRFKAGFHMIAGDRRRSQTITDRRSQIADDRKESCFNIIADDRRRSQSPLFGQRKCQKLPARCAGGKVAANNMADVEEEILLQANLFLLLVLKRRHRQL